MADGKSEAILLCDSLGRVLRVLRDSTGLFAPDAAGARFWMFADKPLRPGLGRFFRETKRRGAALREEAPLRTAGRLAAASGFGLVRNDCVCVIFAESPGALFSLYDEMMGVVGEGGAQSRPLLPEAFDSVVLNEFMTVNNELATMQRELNLSNSRLLRQKARFLKVIQACPDLIVVNDASGRLLFLNKAARSFFGLETEEVLDKELCLLLPPGAEPPARSATATGAR